jgi:predicted alpha/beta superfamily hydrolase
MIRIFAQENAQSSEKPFVLGVTHTFHSAELGEDRKLNVYLPEGYAADPKTAYPVIYLLDGSADEDFIHIAGLVQYSNFSWVDILPKSIVVGIENVDRRRDFTFPTSVEKDKKDFPTTGGSGRFIAFVEKELQPLIEKKYRTSSSKTIIGQSLGGLLAVEILFKKPQLFTDYIIVSPSLWWDKESLLAAPVAVLKPGFKQKTSVYIAVGKEGKIMEGDARKLVWMLKKGNPANLRVSFKYFPAEDHATIFHNAVYQGFQSLHPKPVKNK